MPPQLNEIVGEVIKQCIAEGIPVDLEGLGTFRRTNSGVAFERTAGPRVFIAYVVEDYSCAVKLYQALARAGFNPWLDRKKLLPGQNWRRWYALRSAERMPLDDVFVMPVRLADCQVPKRIAWNIQYVDLFPDWEQGLERLVASIRREWENRQARISG